MKIVYCLSAYFAVFIVWIICFRSSGFYGHLFSDAHGYGNHLEWIFRKELLQKIRMAFAKLPYFKDVTMTDKQIGLILARSARKVRNGGKYLARGGEGKRFSVDGYGLERTGTDGLRFSIAEDGEIRSRTEENGRAYYEIPFADSVDAAIGGTYSGNGDVFMRDTPRIFEDMGFSRLSIMTTSVHIKSIYSPEKTKKDHNHDLGKPQHHKVQFPRRRFRSPDHNATPVFQ